MHLKAVLRVLVLLPGLSLSAAALAQSTQQVLDTVVAYGATKVYEMDLDGAVDVPLDAQIDSSLRACKLTANRGLFCIDAAKNVVNWKNPDSADPGDILFNCTSISEFDAKSSETCTAITLDPAGNIWLAGKNKGKTHSLVKVEACQGGSVTGPGGSYCTTLWATGRPLLLDIEYIGGEAADAFTYGDGVAQKVLGPGVLGLQERKTVVFFSSESNDVTEISSGKTGWGLVGNEQLQGVTLLQPDGTDFDFVLVTTSSGRIIAMNTTTLLPQSIRQQDTCNSRSTQFGIRASAKTGRVYTTSRSCSDFTAYKPSVSVIGGETYVSLVEPFMVALDTPPEGPTIAPGVGVDLNDCTGGTGCEVTVGATLRIGNALASEESGLVVFQVKNIPDCRWNDTKACRDAAAAAAANPEEPDKAVILDLNGDSDDFVGTSDHPTVGDPQVASKQYLNVTPLLPSEITDLFPAPNQLPSLLISPQYRGQNGVFEAFFYVTEEGVRFFGTFDAEYQVSDLADNGSSLGCPSGVFSPGTSPADVLSGLLKWDVATRVSEKYSSVGGPSVDYDHVDTLINTGCGSIVTKKPGFSLVPYNLEITPHTYCDTDLGGVAVIENNDAVFARLLQKLYVDLGSTLDTYACGVLSEGDCSALQTAYADSASKLDRCIEATYQPKTSAGAQNCQSFQSQFKQFTDLLDWAVPNADDPANRIGELQARVAVIQHVYETRFIPSVPVGGFSVEAGRCK